jgi:phosphoribosylformylglycinamidine synthase
VLVTVGREDDVKFQALCEARGVPCLRIGVTDATSGLVEIKDVADLKLDDIRQGWSGVMSGLVWGHVRFVWVTLLGVG